MENLSEFENALLDLLDFTVTAVQANQKVPEYERLQQRAKEWSVNLLYLARKQINNEINKQIEKYQDEVKRAIEQEDYIYASGKRDAMVCLQTLIS